MVIEKMNWSRGLFSGQVLFGLMGVANLLGFGLSLVMEKRNFDYYFFMNGNGKFFQPVRSMCASDNLFNVMWTAPSLILGGAYLNKCLGAMKLTQFFFGALTSSVVFTQCFGPQTSLGQSFNARFAWDAIGLPRFCAIRDGQGQVGAD